MGLSAYAYQQQLLALYPRGALWTGMRRGVVWLGLHLGIAKGLARADAAIEQLPIEADPRFTNALLSEWERSVGLPDGCVPLGASTQQRRAAVVARLNAVGGCSVSYLRALAASVGYPEVTITEIGPWELRIIVPGIVIRSATCNDTCNDLLRTWVGDADLLMCVINRYKHAHVAVDFVIPES